MTDGGLRVLAWSDLHVDYADNARKVAAVAAEDHAGEVLLLPGDVTDDLTLLADVLAALAGSFEAVFFVPGNHELWVRRHEAADALTKLAATLDLCDRLGVHTGPRRIGGVWIVPLLSWYARPHESDDSLFTEKPGEDPRRVTWADDHFVRWPPQVTSPAATLLERNHAALRALPSSASPVITCSHFLPRRELLFADPDATDRTRDRAPAFNFSRVAGTLELDGQVRRLGARLHVYGHQHRNRWRDLDGVTYVSHCLGYPNERGCGSGLAADRPRPIWEHGRVSVPR